MNRLSIWILAGALAVTLHAQSYQRRAAMVRGGSNEGGKCTVEVVVDGAAEVEIRGDTAQIRNLSGQPPEWRRFECTGPLPANPVNFRFSGVDGRGRQELVRDPRNGGSAVVRIEDSEGGREGYTFDITWGGGVGGYPNAGYPNQDNRYDRDREYRDSRDREYRDRDGRSEFRWGGRVVDRDYATNQAVNVCRDAVRQQAMNQYRPGRVEFREMRLDDNPGRHDYVIGMLDVYHRNGREDHYRFNCSVDFDSGRVRTANIEPMYRH